MFALRLATEEMRRRIPVRALVIAAVLFNPAVSALSTMWGQVDALPATFVVASLLLVLTGRPSLRRDTLAVVMFAIAFSMKPQSSFLAPVVVYALYRRYMYRRSAARTGSGPREDRRRRSGRRGSVGGVG